MKHKNMFTLAAIVVTAALFLGPSSGQNGDYAGAPGDIGTCSNNGACHTGGAGGGSVALTGMPSTYSAGQTYPLTLFIFDGAAVKAGYQIVATDGATNTQIGTFQNYPANSQLTGTGRLIQNTPATFSTGAVSWSFEWKAPTSGNPSTIKFYYVGNAVNADGTTGGDFVYASSTTAALPIELGNFSAKTAQNGSVLLNWETFSEKNNDRFEVERSINDDPFEAIGSVKGSGTTTEPNRYRFSDLPMTNGGTTVKYRLQQFDFDGKSTLSNIATVEFGDRAALEIWPNMAPAGEAVSLRLSGFETVDRIEVFDFSGKLVFSENGPTEPGDRQLLPTDGWANGQYFVKVTGDGTARTAPFFVL